jgi:hypothetical protein
MTARRAAGLTALVAFALALPTVGYGFVMEEQREVIVHNEALRSLANVPRFFAGPWIAGGLGLNYYRPLPSSLHAIEYALFGLHAWGWHLVSVLLYALTTALVTLLLARVTRNDRAALLGGLLFAVHPVHVEPVAAVSYQTALLSGVLGAMALLAFGRVLDGHRRALVGLGLALAGALMSKEEAFALPLLMVAWAILERPAGWRRSLAQAMAVVVPVAVALFLVRRLTVAPVTVTFFGHDVGRKAVALTMLSTARLDLELLVFPLRLCPFYDWFIVPLEESVSPAVITGAAIVLGLGLTIALCARRAPAIAIGLAWLMLAMLPVIQLVPFVVVAADRFLFIPSIGWCLALGVLAARAWDRARRPALLACAIALSLYATRAALRFPAWHDDDRLNLATAAAFPETPTPWLNLADLQEARGDRPAAIASLMKALERAPGWAVAEQRLARLRAQ